MIQHSHGGFQLIEKWWVETTHPTDYQSVLDRIEMYVINMAIEIVLVADAMLPKSSLP